jgi:hypothetical protein
MHDINSMDNGCGGKTGQNRMTIHHAYAKHAGIKIVIFGTKMSTNQNQNGFATAMITMITINPVGTSFQIR